MMGQKDEFVINLTNKNKRTEMETIPAEELAIYKFQPHNILMVHKPTKNLYQYFQTPILAPKQPLLLHNNLLSASFLPTGILYIKPLTTLEAQTNKRLHSQNKFFYEEQQLTNTFAPILNCLQYLHSKGKVHGSLCPGNIVFNDEGDVLLRDWLLEIPNNKFYDIQKLSQRTFNEDIAALGLILLESSALIQINPQNKTPTFLQSILKKITQKYSRGYVLAVYIMIRKVQKFYPHLEKILKNNETYIQSSEQLLSMYRKIKGEKQLKPTVTPMLLNHTNFKYLDLICKTPLTTKKVAKIEDVQNKKTHLEQTKKRVFQRNNKISQRNNYINQQTTKKPDMALKKMSNIKISNNQDLQKSHKKVSTKQEILKFSTPLKRLKTVSKKKAF